MLRILMVNKFHYLKGGSETYHFAVGETLEAMGHEVAWFAMKGTENLPCRQSRHFVSPRNYTEEASLLRKVRDGIALVYSFEARRKFNDLLEEFQPDVIHLNLVHRQLTFSILDAPYLKRHSVPVVYTAHDYVPVCPACTMLDGEGNVCDECLSGDFSACVRKRCVKGSKAKSALAAMEARFLRAHGSYGKIDRIIAPSDFMRSKLVEGGFPPDQVITMLNFATDAVLDRARTKEDLTNRSSPYLLYFGRLSKEKGIDILIEAFLSIAERIPAWRLVVAGEGPEREAIETQLSRHPLGSRVELVGLIQGASLLSLVERAAFAVTSARCCEVLCYSNMEALACGTPVICTEIGGMPELVVDNFTGYFCKPNDVTSLSEAVFLGVTIFDEVTAYRAMQARCRAFVLENCNTSSYMNRLVSLYRELVDRKKGAR